MAPYSTSVKLQVYRLVYKNMFSGLNSAYTRGELHTRQNGTFLKPNLEVK